MLTPGARAPHFTLTDDVGAPHTLASLTEHGPLILYFYPADRSPGCAKQACAIRDIHKPLAAAGITVAGVSPQGAISHAKFRAKHDLPFILLTDPTTTIISEYQANGPFGFGVRRVTYLIGANRRIQNALRADFSIDKHRDFVANALQNAPKPAIPHDDPEDPGCDPSSGSEPTSEPATIQP
ncbi:MAG: peroxiredoxin [Phycisphaerales bacterium JB059]